MGSYVLASDAAILLAEKRFAVSNAHELLAPSLLRSQVLSRLYRATLAGELTKERADQHLAYIRALRMRLLGDRVLHNVAWKLAEQHGWPDTMDAEYVALTQLHGDALITHDRKLAKTVKGLVEVAPIDVLRGRN